MQLENNQLVDSAREQRMRRVKSSACGGTRSVQELAHVEAENNELVHSAGARGKRRVK